MKILLLNQTSHIYSGSGAVVHQLKEKLSDELLILTEEGKSSKDKLIDAVPILGPLKLPAKGKRFTYWLNWFQINKAKKNALKALGDFKPDVVMAIFPDEYFLYLGRIIAKKLNCPFVPWFHNTYAENRRGLDKLISSFTQPKVFQDATVILTISNGLTDYYKEKYPKHRQKFKTLQHGFEPNVLKLSISDNIVREDKVKFAFTGSLNSSCKEAAARLFRVIGNNDRFELHIFSGTSENSFKKLIPKETNYIYHGFLPVDEFNTAVSGCDINLVAHGFHGDIHPVEYQTIFPTRTIPLLHIQKPILFHSPSYASFTQFIKKNDCGFIVEKADEDLIRETIEVILGKEDLVKQKIQNALKTAQYFDINHTSEKLKNILAEVI